MGKDIKPKKIYESPDKGKTVYERDFGNYKDKKLIKPKDKPHAAQ